MFRWFVGMVATAAIVLMTGEALAKKTPEEVFKSLDKNKDGKLTMSEMVGNKEGEAKTKAENAFKKADKNHDGTVTLDEFKKKDQGGKGGKKKR